ncbi:DmsC/YnfH family molybdoenzyme membrane anchor subunit [Apirhabdus apintestini]|nr:DmsC/YnfH family molybdoenzyme membrane anchor subunit [Enterobacteriaceae bacterium CA-0114]
MHELPLILFTLLVQASVGVMCVFACFSPKSLAPTQRTLAVLFICFSAGLGLLASTLHMGYPLNAFNALRHFASSWLSREIVFAALYHGLSGIALLCALLRRTPPRVLLFAAALCGLVDLLCMSAIYMHATVVTWRHINTLFMFYGSAALLGAVFSAWILPLSPRALRVLAGIAIAALALRLLVQPDYISWLSDAARSEAVTFPHYPLTAFRLLSGMRLSAWISSAVGVLLFTLAARRGKSPLLLSGCVLIAVAEILQRFTFFSIQ